MTDMKQLPTPAKPVAKTDPDHHRKSISAGLRRHVTIGLLSVAVLVFGIGGLAAMIDFAGAVVGHGTLVVGGNVKKIQHQSGGTVAEILVQEGDKVKAGDVLIRLDPTMAAANRGIVTKGVFEALAQKARLEAERSGGTELDFPKALTDHADQPEVAEIIRIETNAFDAGVAARAGQKEQLRKKINQLEQQLVGLHAQEDAVKRQIALAKDEVEGLRTLRGQDLVSTQRITEAESRAAQLDGQLGQIIASIAQTGAEIAGAELQIIQVEQDVRSKASEQLADNTSRLNELIERKIAADDQFEKQTIVAPIAGTVYQLAVHTIGGVINPGEQIMLIVPENDQLVVEAQISPAQIDRVHADQEAILRFTSFGSRETPEYQGNVVNVSPDLITDQRTGVNYYKARITMPQEALDDLGSRFVPGMPVEVFIVTGDRTVLSYLTKPLADQIMHTFRER
ncbi:MAG: HlyD family type I secretion periplasmic adaptor subunit [Bauldia sp.]|nr:HlyD family type I secretion periplasmic adaptor subunit [Bauldia sp.]